MDFTIYLNVAFIAVYGAILGLVAPYVGAASKSYHSTAPGVIAIIFGSLLWAILTWTGLSYEQPWIWLIVMLTMPAAMWFGAKRLESIRA